MPAPDLSILRRPLNELPDVLPLPVLRRTPRSMFRAEILPPGSKSLTNRAVLLAALADGTSILRSALLDADDAQRMLAALQQLGVGITRRPDPSGTETLEVRGVGGRWQPTVSPLELNLNNAGTATRFLAASALLSPAPVVIDGNARMRERPIAELADTLTALGARVEYLGKPGCPPLRITPPTAATRKASVDIPTTQSSQFISALLLIAPWLEGGLTIRLTGSITSASYVEMTVGLLHRLGATVKTSEDLHVLRVGSTPATENGARRGLAPFTYEVEPDASGATYFWAAGALVPGAECRVMGLGGTSLQGDTDFPDELARMGVPVQKSEGDPSSGSRASISTRGPNRLDAILSDLSNMPDAAMTLAVVASFATGTSILRGLGTLRVKETDRLAAIKNELTKLGVHCVNPVAGDRDVMTITAPANGIDCSPDCPPVTFETYDDHRMAMSLALVALRRPNVFIRHPQCVAKTYPTFWADFARLYDGGI